MEHAHCLSADYSENDEQIIEGWPLMSHWRRPLMYILLPCVDFLCLLLFPFLPYLSLTSLLKYFTVRLRRWAGVVRALVAQAGGHEFEFQAPMYKVVYS